MVLAMTGEVMTDEESDEDENKQKIIVRRRLNWRNEKFERLLAKINAQTTSKAMMHRIDGLPSARQPTEKTAAIFVRKVTNDEE